jgi:hypothetical protein
MPDLLHALLNRFDGFRVTHRGNLLPGEISSRVREHQPQASTRDPPGGLELPRKSLVAGWTRVNKAFINDCQMPATPSRE